MALVLLTGARVYAPEPLGACSILFAPAGVLARGDIEAGALRASGLHLEVVNVSGCVVAPGLLDPHEHLLGAGGEQAFSSRMPPVDVGELAACGITTVVGVLGTDTVTRSLPDLLGKVRELAARGIGAYMYTGGFQLPLPKLTASTQEDLVLIPEVIGVGELAISDARSIEPTRDDLAKLVSQTLTGGMIGGKAGVTHFHVGEGDRRLALLRELLDTYPIPAECLYPTHCSRTDSLLEEAAGLAKRGCYVDLDATNEDVARGLVRYREVGGPPERLTISSDAHTPGGNPQKLFGQLVACVQDAGMALEDVLPHLTANPAAALKLGKKGHIAEGMDADLLILDEQTLEPVHLFAGGRPLLRDGQLVAES